MFRAKEKTGSEMRYENTFLAKGVRNCTVVPFHSAPLPFGTLLPSVANFGYSQNVGRN